MVTRHRSLNRGTVLCAIAALVLLLASGAGVMQAQTQTQTFACPTGFTEEAAPPVLLTSLQLVENPVIDRDPITGAALLRDDLAEYINNVPAAVRLGKALFWEMQAGSDNATACASCHHHAGEDGRTRHQLNPGLDLSWDRHQIANAELTETSFPFTVIDPQSDADGDGHADLVHDSDNIAGSQGVRRSAFGGISRTGVESTTPIADPVYTSGTKNRRQVTGRNTPNIYNAVFNHRNFHDGRAQAEFNGVNPFGRRDANAKVWYVGLTGPAQMSITINEASLASQAVGPAMDNVEMSAVGRTFPDLGVKLLAVKPLGLQKVDPTDSVLGAYADTTAGLRLTYAQMIQAAFKQKWWNSSKSVRMPNGKSYTMMQANMSLFWGLSIMMYEATLVSDQTPIDQYLRHRSFPGLPADISGIQQAVNNLQSDYPGLTVDNVLNGLRLFENPPPPMGAGAGCSACHVGAELTAASVQNLMHGIEPGDAAFAGAGFDQRSERMFLRIPPVPPGTTSVTLNPMTWTMTASPVPPPDVPIGVYDAGFYNIGVRPEAENAGVGGVDPWGKSLSIPRLQQQTLPDTTIVKVPGGGVMCGTQLLRNTTNFPMLSGSLRKTERTFVDGAFKVPGLRNVEFTGPYLHNGGKSTLLQVMELYDDGGDFNNPTLAPLIRPLGLSAEQVRDLIAFLLALSDERVRWQRAPFDHPQLFVPNGESAPGVDNMIEIPAVGAGGAAMPRARFLGLNPFMP